MKNNLFKKVFGADVRSLAFFRIMLGLLILHDFITLGVNYKAFYTSEGFLPAGFLITSVKPLGHISAFLMNDSPEVVLFLLILSGLFTVAFILGYKTRWSNFWMWFMLMSLHTRNLTVLGGSDNLVRIMAFTSIFVPLSEVWAWDASPAADRKKIECSISVFALMMQICFVYVFTAYFKSLCVDWMDGNGLLYALQGVETQLPLGAYLMNFPKALPFMTYATLILEAFGPFLFFMPIFNGFFRSVALIAFTMLQTGISISLDVLNFPGITMIGTIPFIPSFWWDTLEQCQPVKRITPLLSRIFTLPAFLGQRPSDGKREPVVRRIMNVLALFFLMVNLYHNILTMDYEHFKLPAPLQKLNQTFFLDHWWAMYANNKHYSNNNGWYVVQGTLKDGSKMDIFRNDTLDWECPKVFRDAYISSRWKLVICILSSPYNAPIRPYFLSYLTRKWNSTHKGNLQIARVDYYQVWQTIRPTLGPPQYILLQSYIPPS